MLGTELSYCGTGILTARLNTHPSLFLYSRFKLVHEFQALCLLQMFIVIGHFHEIVTLRSFLRTNHFEILITFI